MQTATATATAEAWLDAFAASLDSRDIRAVLALFGPECFWRDLVAFTWNLHIEEGAEAIAAMLAARLEDVAPRGFALRGEASEHEGLLEAWFDFETRVGRCTGQLRLRDGRAWTLFTALDELKGHEERGASGGRWERSMACIPGATPGPSGARRSGRPWAAARNRMW